MHDFRKKDLVKDCINKTYDEIDIRQGFWILWLVDVDPSMFQRH